MTRLAFTLIELILVIVIIMLLAGLVFLSTRDLLDQIKVQKTATTVVQTITMAQQAATARGLAYSVYFNNGISPDDPAWVIAKNLPGAPIPSYSRLELLGTLSPNLDDYRVFTYSAGSMTHIVHMDDSMAVNHPHGMYPVRMSEQAMQSGRWKLWTTDPAQQWMMVMGPWQAANGGWYQAKGAMPVLRIWDNISGAERPFGAGSLAAIDGIRRPIGNHAGVGGIYGHPLDGLGRLPLAQCGGSNPGDAKPLDIPEFRPRWDPYNLMVGPRRLFESGTRLMIPQDHPHWRRFCRRRIEDPENGNINSLSSYQVGYNGVALPWLAGGWGVLTPALNNAGFVVQNLNCHPGGTVTLNACDPSENRPAQPPFIYRRLTGLVGIVSTRTEIAPMPNQVIPEPLEYYRPKAILFVTVRVNGELLVDARPYLNN